MWVNPRDRQAVLCSARLACSPMKEMYRNNLGQHTKHQRRLCTAPWWTKTQMHFVDFPNFDKKNVLGINYNILCIQRVRSIPKEIIKLWFYLLEEEIVFKSSTEAKYPGRIHNLRSKHNLNSSLAFRITKCCQDSINSKLGWRLGGLQLLWQISHKKFHPTKRICKRPI